MKIDPVDRFWGNVDLSAGNGSIACWIWRGTVSGSHGTYFANGTRQYAHAYSLALADRPIGNGQRAYSICGTPLCVRPGHWKIKDTYARDERVRTGRVRVQRAIQAPRPTITTDDRFWSKVDKSSGHCWVWTGARLPNGYGSFGDPIQKRQVGAHRYSWELVRGPIPNGIRMGWVCGDTLCVNPDHLFVQSNENHPEERFWSKVDKSSSGVG